MKFSEAVTRYSEWKKSNRGTSKVTGSELANIRKAYNTGKFVENTNVSPAKKLINEYSEWKYAKTGSRYVSLKERQTIARSVNQSRFHESTSPAKTFSKQRFTEAVSRYSSWKKANKGTAMVNLKERQFLATQFGFIPEEKMTNEPDMNKVRKMIGGTDWDSAQRKLTMHESRMTSVQKANKIKKSIREARIHVFNAKKALREGDVMGAADQTQMAGDAINSVDAAQPQAQVPQNIVDIVSQLKSTVDDLATQCGIESPVNLQGDPNAGVPPVTGAADPNAAPVGANGPVMEGKKVASGRVEEIRARIAKRNAAMKESENPVQDWAKGVFGGLNRANPEVVPEGSIDSAITPNNNKTIDKANDDSQLKEPSLSELTNGSKTAAKCWPSQKIAVKEGQNDNSLASKMVENTIKDEEDNWDFATILDKGLLSGNLG